MPHLPLPYEPSSSHRYNVSAGAEDLRKTPRISIKPWEPARHTRKKTRKCYLRSLEVKPWKDSVMGHLWTNSALVLLSSSSDFVLLPPALYTWQWQLAAVTWTLPECLREIWWEGSETRNERCCRYWLAQNKYDAYGCVGDPVQVELIWHLTVEISNYISFLHWKVKPHGSGYGIMILGSEWLVMKWFSLKNFLEES